MVMWLPINEVEIYDASKVDPAIATETQGRQIPINVDWLLK